MAFDLNKNDGSHTGSSNKTQTPPKFDLTKGEAAEASLPKKSSNSVTGLIGLLAILIIGGGIWYYSSLPKIAGAADVATASIKSDSVAVVEDQVQTASGAIVADTTALAAPSAPNDAVPAQLNHKVPATFVQGSASFTRIDQSLVKRITSYLSTHPKALITVNGYASSDGSLEINQTVSQARANAFKEYLISKSVAEDRVVAIGKGIENPIASNDTNAGRKKNRRVEITFP
ncbi:OmpA family protein [Pedobacter sp. AW31-3R]|uniref:OmpA family protein n=1 Tax=Pedobacter sp. AW31-3R TaxID=3445781 RepID=UPI003FA04D5C